MSIIKTDNSATQPQSTQSTTHSQQCQHSIVVVSSIQLSARSTQSNAVCTVCTVSAVNTVHTLSITLPTRTQHNNNMASWIQSAPVNTIRSVDSSIVNAGNTVNAANTVCKVSSAVEAVSTAVNTAVNKQNTQFWLLLKKARFSPTFRVYADLIIKWLNLSKSIRAPWRSSTLSQSTQSSSRAASALS